MGGMGLPTFDEAEERAKADARAKAHEDAMRAVFAITAEARWIWLAEYEGGGTICAAHTKREALKLARRIAEIVRQDPMAGLRYDPDGPPYTSKDFVVERIPVFGGK